MSDDNVEEKVLKKFAEDGKKTSDNEIEIVEMTQTNKIGSKTSESPQLANSLAPNYCQSLKNVLSSKVK